MEKGSRGYSDWIKIAALLALGLAVLGLGVINLRDRISWNDPHDGISWVEGDDGVSVYRVLDDGLARDVKPGDLLLRINQHDILNLRDYTDLLFMFGSGERVFYFFKDAATGDLKRVSLTIQTRPILTVKDLFRVVVACVYLAIGLLILIKYWHNKGGIHFYLVCLFSFSLYLFAYTKRLNFLDYVVYWVSVCSILFLPPLFLHFSFCFPNRRFFLRKYPALIWLIYLPFLFLLGLQALWSAGLLGIVGLYRDLSSRSLLDNVHLVYFTLYFLVGLALLFHSRFSSRSTELRQQMKWIVIGATLSLVPFSFLYVAPFLLNIEISSFMEASILSLAFLPLSFAYAIMKYRLMDVDILFKQGTAFFFALVAGVALYFIAAGLCGPVLDLFAPGSVTLVVLVSAITAALLFNPIRHRIQVELDRVFYKDEYKYRQSLIEFGRVLSTENSLETVTTTIMDRVLKSLKVETTGIFLKIPEEPEEYELVAHRGVRLPSEKSRHFRIPESFFIRGADVPTVSFQIFGKESPDWSGSLRELYQGMTLHYFQPLINGEQIIGVLALGRGPNETYLSSEDLELLHALAVYAAIALENARLYSSLQNKARELEMLKVYSENIVEGINVGVMALTREGVITTWNQSMEKLHGLSADEAIGQEFRRIFPPDLVDTIWNACRNWEFDTMVPSSFYKLFLLNRLDQRKFVNLTVSPFLDASDSRIGTLLAFDDVTAKVQLEQQLLQAEKLSSLGLIAAGVAHEVNTPLTGISSFTQMLKEEVPRDHPHRGVLDKIETQCFRASEIVSNLLNFARLQTAELKPVYLNEIVTETIALVEHQFLKKEIRLWQQLAPGLPCVRGNEGQLMQVLVNILLNAKDAVSNGGEVRIQTSAAPGFVIIMVEDNGPGIPPEVISRIFDPFFTTKDVGKGTGLGLSVSYGIIQEHSGHIFVDSRAGEGTCFTIKLPAIACENEEGNHEHAKVVS